MGVVLINWAWLKILRDSKNPRSAPGLPGSLSPPQREPRYQAM